MLDGEMRFQGLCSGDEPYPQLPSPVRFARKCHPTGTCLWEPIV